MKKTIILILICLSSLITEAQKTNIKVWKTITLGNSTKPDLIKKLKQKGLNPFSYGNRNYIDSIQIEKKQKIKLALVSLDDLGYKLGGYMIDYNKVCKLAKKKGLKLCPREVVLQLPIQYSPKSENIDSVFNIIIAMKQIRVPQDKGSKWYWETVYSYSYGFVRDGPHPYGCFLSEITMTDGIGYGGDQSDLLENNKFVFIIP